MLVVFSVSLLMMLFSPTSTRVSLLGSKSILLTFFLCLLMGTSLEGFVVSGFYLGPMGVSLGVLSVWMLLLMYLVEMKTAKTVIFVLFAAMEACLLLFFTADNYLVFYLAFESVLVPIVVLVYMAGGNKEREVSGTYMLLYTLAASLPLLLMVFYLGDSLSLSSLYVMSMSKTFLVESPLLVVALFLAFLVKLPIYGLHFWLPKAHVEASLAGSMILAGVLLKMGGFGLYRFSQVLFVEGLMAWGAYVVSLVVLGAFFTSFVCIRQTDAKSLIAYSSVCHMSLIFTGYISMASLAGSGSMILMLGHGLCSSGLFYLVGVYYDRLHSRSLMFLSGMTVVVPLLTYWWFIFSVFNMGAPPSMNLLGEIFLMGSTLKWSLMLVVVLIGLSLMSGAYSIYLFSQTQHGKSWAFYSFPGVDVKDFVVMSLHVLPLVFYILKVEVFMCY